MNKFNFIRAVIFADTLLLQLSAVCFQSRATAGDVDLSFDPGVDGEVKAIALQPDGKLLVGGGIPACR